MAFTTTAQVPSNDETVPLVLVRIISIPVLHERIRRLQAFHLTWEGNRLERLRGDRKGQYSIRVDDEWSVRLKWRDGHACEVGIVDYH